MAFFRVCRPQQSVSFGHAEQRGCCVKAGHDNIPFDDVAAYRVTGVRPERSTGAPDTIDHA
jgi:hypothetical protein